MSEIKTAAPLGSWTADGYWRPNPLLTMSVEDQRAHNVRHGYIKEHDMTNSEKLQRALGYGFRVLRWVGHSGYHPDEVVIVRSIDGRYECFHVEKDLLDDSAFMPTLASSIRHQFAGISIKNARLEAFEKIVKDQSLPLNLDRLSNETRYESMETEWAFRFWNKGLDVSVGDKIGHSIKPTKVLDQL